MVYSSSHCTIFYGRGQEIARNGPRKCLIRTNTALLIFSRTYYWVVKLNFTPEIEIFFVLLARYLSIFSVTSLKLNTSISGVKSSWTSLYRGVKRLRTTPLRCTGWTLHSEQAVCNVKYLFAYSKTFLLGKILQIFKNKHYKGEQNIMFHYF